MTAKSLVETAISVFLLPLAVIVLSVWYIIKRRNIIAARMEAIRQKRGTGMPNTWR